MKLARRTAPAAAAPPVDAARTLAFLADHRFVDRLTTPLSAAFFAAGLLFAAVMGVARAATMRMDVTVDGTVVEGSWRTGAMWLATVGVGVAMFVAAAKAGATEGAGEAMLYVAMTLAAQNLLLARRAGLLPARTPLAPAQITPAAELVG